MKIPPPALAPTDLTLLRSLAVLVLAMGLASCAGASKRIPDPACENCYRTESGIFYKTWEAYDP